MRKTLLIISAIIVILGGAAGIYFYLATKAPSINVSTPPTGGTLPVAGESTTTTTTSNTSGTSGVGTAPGTIASPTQISSRLVEISSGPVVPGEIVLDPQTSKTATSSPGATVQFIEQQSGNVYSYNTKTNILTRINNKTLPGIQSAKWLPDGSAAFVQYLSGANDKTINTYSLAASSTAGFFLPQDLSGLAVSANKVLTLASGSNGSVASLANIDGGNSSTVFTTPLSDLRIAFSGKNHYLAFSKPSGSLGGNAFLFNAKGVFTHVVGPLNGLVVLPSPSGEWLLVSYTQAKNMYTELVNTNTDESIALPVATIADKCVWTQDSTSVYCGVPKNPSNTYLYPDDWYQGAVHFSDRIWQINVSGRYAQLVLDFSSANKGPLDATSLAIDPKNSTLVFINKNNGSLWSYSL